MRRFAFSQELISETFDECFELYKEHADEHLKELPFRLNREAYVAAEKSGHATVFYVRDVEDGRAVGFAGYLLQVNPHSGLSQAYCDSLYVRKKYRGLVGLNFMKFCDEKLRAVGVKQFQHSSPLSQGGATMGGALVRQGYKAIEVIYQKVIL